MKTNKILTISVAAYNVEKYIGQTLESILNSKYKEEIEIIVTNDESKDTTGNIIESFYEKYPTIIKYINQKNHGAGSTVNNGMEHATGKYFKMVDGDDYVDTNSLDIFIETLKKIDCDMVISDYSYYYESNQKNERGSYFKIDANKVYSFSDVCLDLNITTPSIAYKTSILQENHIRLDERYYTDFQYQLYPIPFVQDIYYSDVNLYFYRIGREGQSVGVKGFQAHLKDHELVLFKLIHFYEKINHDCSSYHKKYIVQKIASMGKTHISVLLSFPASKFRKKEIIDTLKQISQDSKEIYEYLKNISFIRILIQSNYHFYSILSFMKRIKNRV